MLSESIASMYGVEARQGRGKRCKGHASSFEKGIGTKNMINETAAWEFTSRSEAWHIYLSRLLSELLSCSCVFRAGLQTMQWQLPISRKLNGIVGSENTP